MNTDRAKAILAIIFALAIVNTSCFIFSSRKKADQSEAKTNLASISTAEIAFIAETDSWGANFDIIGWSPSGETKYSYYMACYNCATGIELDDRYYVTKKEIAKGWTGLDCSIAIPSTLPGPKECPAELVEWMKRSCAEDYQNRSEEEIEKMGCFRAGAVANLDKDETLDIWAIDMRKEPINIVNDAIQ